MKMDEVAATRAYGALQLKAVYRIYFICVVIIFMCSTGSW